MEAGKALRSLRAALQSWEGHWKYCRQERAALLWKPVVLQEGVVTCGWLATSPSHLELQEGPAGKGQFDPLMQMRGALTTDSW